MPRIAGIIVNMVPYHHARWEAFAVSSGSETHLVELTDRDDFKVLEFSKESHFLRHTLFPSGKKEMPSTLNQAMSERLDALAPDVICVSGWGLKVSLAAMLWAVRRGAPIVMLSESNEFDEVRSTIKEFIKRRLVSLCSAGLAGGSPQADYLVKLGLPRERVFKGYDVVDNGFFKTEGERLKAEGGSEDLLNQKKTFFLACARFGKKKNLPGLIRAYARYRQLAKPSTLDPRHSTAEAAATSAFSLQPLAFDLVIAGEGEQRAEIEQTIRECGVADHVHLIGPKGYNELPGYYAAAGAFIHASTTEQWGLVVNEAMASGLPVLVSNRCGCAADLVQDGVNGWTFDPTDEEQIAELMMRISSDEDGRLKMGARSREIITEWGPDRFASGLKSAVDAALKAPRRRAGILNRLILLAMTRR
jgi:glycosyltransferase involved in cell wall biosynthesis